MENAPALRTNKNKKKVFIISGGISMLCSSYLYSSIGQNIIMMAIFGLGGVASVVFQGLKLREYKNSKGKNKIALAIYVLFTIVSYLGSIGTGYANIKKAQLKNSVVEAKIKIIEKQLLSLEKESPIETAIDTVLKKTNVNQWAAIRMMKEKKMIANKKGDDFEKIKELEIAKAELKENNASINNAVDSIAELANIDRAMAMLIFLGFFSLAIEIMFNGSANYTGTLFDYKRTKIQKKKITKKEKEKKAGQEYFSLKKLS